MVLSKLTALVSTDMAIDLGTANTLISVKGSDRNNQNDWLETGLMAFFNYHVGKKGLPVVFKKLVLNRNTLKNFIVLLVNFHINIKIIKVIQIKRKL